MIVKGFVLSFMLTASLSAELYDNELIDLAEASEPDPDFAVAECVSQSMTDAVTHCQRKPSQEQCDGAMRDWYCQIDEAYECSNNQHVGVNAMDQNRTVCHKLVSGGPDLMRPAKCCTWASGACTFDASNMVLSNGTNGTDPVWEVNSCVGTGPAATEA